jgi:DNA transformation protein
MSGFNDFVLELLEGLGPVRVRRMFGGAGVYAGELMFGVVFDDVLYMRADEPMRAELAALGSAPFVYQSPRGPMEMSYWRLPETAMDDPDEAVAWARRSLAVAEAHAAAKPKKRRGKPAPG